MLNIGIQPSEFWTMTIENIAGLSYWIKNKGDKPMSLDEYKELKKKVGANG